jgi:hypothetical protein
MSKVLLIMHHIALCTPRIEFLLVSYTWTFTLDPAEQAPKEPQEPVQVKELNPKEEQEQEQGKSRCI